MTDAPYRTYSNSYRVRYQIPPLLPDVISVMRNDWVHLRACLQAYMPSMVRNAEGGQSRVFVGVSPPAEELREGDLAIPVLHLSAKEGDFFFQDGYEASLQVRKAILRGGNILVVHDNSVETALFVCALALSRLWGMDGPALLEYLCGRHDIAAHTFVEPRSPLRLSQASFSANFLRHLHGIHSNSVASGNSSGPTPKWVAMGMVEAITWNYLMQLIDNPLEHMKDDDANDDGEDHGAGEMVISEVQGVLAEAMTHMADLNTGRRIVALDFIADVTVTVLRQPYLSEAEFFGNLEYAGTLNPFDNPSFVFWLANGLQPVHRHRLFRTMVAHLSNQMGVSALRGQIDAMVPADVTERPWRGAATNDAALAMVAHHLAPTDPFWITIVHLLLRLEDRLARQSSPPRASMPFFVGLAKALGVCLEESNARD